MSEEHELQSSPDREESSSTSETKLADQLARLRPDVENLSRVLGFGPFLESGFRPTISDVEIVVCFADIRGFTAYCRDLQREMQDRKIHAFLRTYLRIYAEGLYQWLLLSIDDPGPKPERTARVREHIMPSMFKNLGDGLMLVWEIPPGIEPELQGSLVQSIIFAVGQIEDRFYHRFRNLNDVAVDSLSREVEKLEIGFGIAKGHAWRMDFGRSIDYAGSIINLASRLQDFARPSGIVCHYDSSTWLFDRLAAAGNGRLLTVGPVKGYGTGVRIWAGSNVQCEGQPFDPSCP